MMTTVATTVDDISSAAASAKVIIELDCKKGLIFYTQKPLIEQFNKLKILVLKIQNDIMTLVRKC